jgi:hypothetical protein
MDNHSVDSDKPSGWRAWLAHAFAIDKYDESSLEPAEKALLTRLALEINARSMATPAIIYIHSQRHMSWLFSQAMVAAEPIIELAHPFVDPLLKRLGLSISKEERWLLISAFEKRFAAEYFVQQIEAASAGTLVPETNDSVAAENAEE